MGELSKQMRGAIARSMKSERSLGAGTRKGLGRPRTTNLDQGSASEFENPSARPSADRLREAWDRNAAPRSITSWVMGDPPPGHSALDKMRAHV
ncbi:hypothetical protein ACRQ5Q_14910 [Bradyrhizobium sp. PMVTL-01]|uniref:hypothetical protein n=1 Tax=Bradyrhizobium sp. PMVTL-01 TaxID=3434999 RepID=UPI003F6EAAC9